MKAIEFKEVNIHIGKGQEEYQTLPARIRQIDVTSPTVMCFELDEEEKKQVSETGRIWITILTFGQSFHPIAMSCMRPEDCTEPNTKLCKECGKQFDGGGWICDNCFAEFTEKNKI